LSDVLYFNGRFTTTEERVLGVEDRGFQFGDAIYEVFKFVSRRPAFMLDHYRRLCAGLRAIEIPSPWDEARFVAVMTELLERTAFESGIVYIQITRGEGERAHFYPENLEPTVVAYSRKLVFPDAAKKERGIRVITTADQRWLHCDVKSVNLLANVLAKKKAQRAGADEPLLIRDGLVHEGSSASFFGVKGGRIVTHPLDENILPGVVRDHAVRLAVTERIPLAERPLREAELFDLDEAFITSTTQAVMPVAFIDGRAIGSGRRGRITERLQLAFDAEERADMSKT
jgi:D-alanine transaminase